MRKPSNPTAERRAAVALLTTGSVTLAEAARFVGVTRQAARKWIPVNAPEMRRRWLREQWATALAEAEKG
jgi:hypothetical protein